MGKSKNKKKPRVDAVASPQMMQPDQQPPPASTVQAMDGHNVDGWTNSQIKAYNELLVERQKLEKQRQELEQRSLKSQAGRALLNDKASIIDSVFKQQKPSGSYVYTGKAPCCVDIGSVKSCNHEICKRAKAEGVSWTEVDTIKYYFLRIEQEKSDRMRNALRKQRDLELIKIRKEDEDGRAKSARKSASRHNGLLGDLTKAATTTNASLENEILAGATKETQRLVTNILEQLDHLRVELQSGQISSTDMQKKLDNIEVEMQAAQLKTSTFKSSSSALLPELPGKLTGANEAFQNTLKERLLSDKEDTYSKAFHIMEHFLSASKPGEFQVAVAELKDVLRLSGPMGDELQKSFDALEGIFDTPDRLSFTGPDGKQECTSIIDLMEKMKETLQRNGTLPEGANAELTKVFQECIDLEADARIQMTRKCEEHLKQDATEDLAPALVEIRASIVSKSPIPPLTEKTLEDEIRNILEGYDVRKLRAMAENGIEAASMEGHITSIVMNRAHKNPDMYLDTIGRLATAYERTKSERDIPLIDNALPKVEAKMKVFVDKLAAKKAAAAVTEIQAHDRIQEIEQYSANSTQLPDPLNDFPENTREIVLGAIDQLRCQNKKGGAHMKLRVLIAEHGHSGLWPLWLMFSDNTQYAEDTALQSKSRDFEDEAARTLTAQSGGIRATVIYLYNTDLCPGMSAAIIAEILAGLSEDDPTSAKAYLESLSSCLQGLHKYVKPIWHVVFQHLTLAMIQLYTAMCESAMSLFQQIPPVHFALSSTAMMITYVCLMRSSEAAQANIEMLCSFVDACLSPNGYEPPVRIQHVLKSFKAFCKNDDYRCLTIEPCSAHFAHTKNPTQDPVTQALSTERSSSIERSSIASHPAAHIGLDSDRGEAVINGTYDPQSPGLERRIHHSKRVSKRTHSINEISQTSTKLSDVLRRAASLHEVTARKALGIMDVRPVSDKSQASEKSMTAMCELTEQLPTDGSIVAQRQTEPQSHDNARNSERRRVQDFFDAIKAGRSHPGLPKQLAQDMKQECLQGSIPNPALWYKQSIESCAKIAEIPSSVHAAMREAHEEIKILMNNPRHHSRWVTNRMRYLLSVVQAKAPTRLAFFDMAYEDPVGLEQYAALLTSERAKRGESTDVVKELVDEVYDKVADSQLHRKSRAIHRFSLFAIDDWAKRGQQIEPDEDDDDDDEGSESDMTDVEEDEGIFVDAAETRSAVTSESQSRHGRNADSTNPDISFKTTASRQPKTSVFKSTSALPRGQSAEFDDWRMPDNLRADSHDPHQPSIRQGARSTSSSKKSLSTSAQGTTSIQSREQLILSRLTAFIHSLQRVEDTRKNILGLVADQNARSTESKLFDRIVTRLQERKTLVVDVLGLIADNNGLGQVGRWVAQERTRDKRR